MRMLVLLLALLLAAPAMAAPAIRVLFVGNSLTYVNDLPALVVAFARAQPGGTGVETRTFVAPGGTLAERWADGAAARELGEHTWDVIVLQERGGVLACLVSSETRGSRDCRESLVAHRAFADLARRRGTRVILLETWSANEASQGTLHDGTTQLARRLDATVVHAGDALQAMAWSEGRSTAFPDRVHPSLTASLVMAAQLCRAITGAPPAAAAVRIDRPLLPAQVAIDPRTPLETQSPATGTTVYVLEPAALAPLLARAARYR